MRRLHHVGIAVAGLDEAINVYARLFGATVEKRERIDHQGVEAVSLLVGDGRVELLAALSDDTPVGRFLAKRGPGMHHVAYAVDDIRAALAELRAQGAQLIDDEPHPGMFGFAAFVHPDAVYGVLSELVSVR